MQNLLIKADSLYGLKYLLDQGYKSKVKLIYIDPPYNTGNDSFKYNDRFNHSTWLTFMKNRLEVAKELLREDGVIFVQIDDNEQAYLKVLMDEIFGRDNFVCCFPRVTKKAGKSTELISKNTDWILFYYKSSILINKQIVNIEEYPYKDDFFDIRGGYKLNQTLDYNSLQYSKTMDYEITINNKSYYPGGIELFNQRRKGVFNKIDWVWRWSYEKLKFGLDNEFIVIKNNRIYTKTYSNATIIKENSIYKIQIEERKKNITSLDYINNIFSNDIATKEMTLLLDVKHLFSYSKPESLLQRIIEMSTTEGDIVLDFFAGSGTTPAVAHKMKRQWIAIEQMDYIEDITKLRLQKVIDGEQGGISKALNWQGGGDFDFIDLQHLAKIPNA